jgi:hypothetical protein
MAQTLPGKTHIALGLGLAACQKGLAVGFTTTAALVHELIEARDEKRLLRLQRQLAACTLLIIDELGYVPLSPTGAELLFEVLSQRYERGSVIVTSNLFFDEWTSVFGSERLTGALLDRLTHHVHVLEMNGDSYRLRQSKHRRRAPSSDASPSQPPDRQMQRAPRGAHSISALCGVRRWGHPVNALALLPVKLWPSCRLVIVPFPSILLFASRPANAGGRCLGESSVRPPSQSTTRDRSC